MWECSISIEIFDITVSVRDGPRISNLYALLNCLALACEQALFGVSPGKGGGGYSTDVWVGRCGWGAQTLTLFKTEKSDFLPVEDKIL